MENTCKSFEAAISPGREKAPASTDLVLGSVVECFNDNGEREIFDGDESGAKVTFNIAGVCRVTHAAVTQNCFRKYCSTEDNTTDCPFKLGEQLATMRELARVAPEEKIKEELDWINKQIKELEMQLLGPAYKYGEGKYAPQEKRLRKLLEQLKRLAEPLETRMQCAQKESAQS